MMCFTIILQVQSGRRKEGVGFYEIYYGRRQGKDEEWSHQACFFGDMYPAGSNIYYFNVYKAQQICRGSQSSDESCGRDRYFEYVCITGYLDDQSAMDSSDPHVPDYGTWLVSSGWSERWYRKDEETLSENRRTAFAAAPGEQKDSGKTAAENSKSRKYFFLYPQKCRVSGVSEYRCDLF